MTPVVSYKFDIRPGFPALVEFKTAIYGAGDAFGNRDKAIEHAKNELLKIDPTSARAKIYALQAEMGSLPEVECGLIHTFAPGVYIRTIHIKAGTAIVGKIHKHAHGNILSQGRVTVLTESGGIENLEAPLTMVSVAGTKRALIAHTDLVWSTIHKTDATDLVELERELIAETYEEYEQFLLEGKPMKQIEVTS